MNLKNKNIICIDLRNFNGKQLDKIADKYGVSLSFLNLLKKEKKAVSIFFDIDKADLVAYRLYERFVDSFKNVYKGMCVTPNYSYMTKKEKDSLLKMKSIDYNSLKVSKSFDVKVEVDTKVNTKVILDTDTILDKISKYGIASLVTEERVFLDNLSKN